VSLLCTPAAGSNSCQSPATQLVTFTMGGNDANFSQVMQDCVEDPFCKNDLNPLVNAKIAQLAGTAASDPMSLSNMYTAIAARAPNATIIVMGYPRFFPANPPAVCYTGLLDLFFIRSEMSWINNEIASMDSTIANAVARVRSNGDKNVLYVTGSFNAFTGHELCTANPYLNPAELSPVFPSFHPNASGNVVMAQLAEEAYRASS
jgi:lysophospholipase L1-like esterase